MTAQTVRLGFGKITLKTASATYSPQRVKAPFVRESAVTTARRNSGTLVSDPVSRFPQINGTMYQDQCTHENGTIIMLQASKKRGGAALADGCILLRLRETAPLLNISGKLPLGAENLLGEGYLLFLGRADILSAEEVAVYQISVPARFVDTFFSMEEIDELFDVTEVASGTAERPEVALISTSTGLVVKEISATPMRRIGRRNR